MTKSLKTLIRLAKKEVDKEQEIVGNLQTRRDALQGRWDKIHNELESERIMAEQDPELLMNFGTYAKNAADKEHKIEADIAKLDERLEIQREKLREAFAEQKKYEIALENKEKEQAEAEKKREQKNLDELASQAHSRKDD